MGQDRSDDQKEKRPAIEWIVGGLGLLITIALVGFVGWQVLQNPGEPPQVDIQVTGIGASADSYLVEVTAINRSSKTVAGLVVEGTLSRSGKEPEKSSTTFDYVPGNSQTHGGLFFNTDPAAGELQVRPTGYRRP